MEKFEYEAEAKAFKEETVEWMTAATKMLLELKDDIADLQQANNELCELVADLEDNQNEPN